jgi:hypothetical protein
MHASIDMMKSLMLGENQVNKEIVIIKKGGALSGLEVRAGMIMNNCIV